LWRYIILDGAEGWLMRSGEPIEGRGLDLDYTRGLGDIGKRDGVARHGLELRARAGLHVGEVLTWRNSDAAVNFGAKPLEVEGLAKPTAGRLMTMARPDIRSASWRERRPSQAR